MKKFKCKYEYSGMETEGRVDTHPEQIIEAEGKAEALYKYLQYVNTLPGVHGPGIKHYYPTLADYKKSDYATGGWGYSAIEIP